MSSSYAQSVDDGKEAFEENCESCHSIGEGVVVGPDLKGVSDRRSLAWITSFVKSSTAVIASGDKDAVAIFTAFEETEMPDQDLTDEQIKSIVGYIGYKGAIAAAADAPKEEERAVTAADVVRGQNLFQGIERLSGNGPACNSCHHVENDAIIGGGILAKELTEVFSRVGGTGVKAILGRAPFAVMRKAYEDRAITEDEVFALVAFLQDADTKKAFSKPADYGWGLLFAGMGGTVVLWILYAILWIGRKKVSVNHSIYERQIKASN
jgi:cytochrome c2